MAEETKIPKHIAFIMDGNGRWAEAKGLSKTKGHEEGARSVEAVTNAALKAGVKYITLYAFEYYHHTTVK
ncbi:undecaprenyl diphosphate synthase family protein [Candidatus Proelusimicrobium excrementi]|uniref:undecaprenyl diphosphate synthase family protein n=1 Tax=Candidatus Proelusimicrobium excrementi TaxID=3416222 RepID=UPI003D0BE158